MRCDFTSSGAQGTGAVPALLAWSHSSPIECLGTKASAQSRVQILPSPHCLPSTGLGENIWVAILAMRRKL